MCVCCDILTIGASPAIWDYEHPSAGEHVMPLPQPSRLVLDFSLLSLPGWLVLY